VGTFYLLGQDDADEDTESTAWVGIVQEMFDHENKMLVHKNVANAQRIVEMTELSGQVGQFFADLEVRVADTNSLWTDLEKGETYDELAGLLSKILLLHDIKMPETELGDKQDTPARKMKTTARLVLEDVIEGGGKSKWDANAIEKCVQGKDGLKGEDAKAKF
jgi:hypothetical protein